MDIFQALINYCSTGGLKEFEFVPLLSEYADDKVEVDWQHIWNEDCMCFFHFWSKDWIIPQSSNSFLLNLLKCFYSHRFLLISLPYYLLFCFFFHIGSLANNDALSPQDN